MFDRRKHPRVAKEIRVRWQLVDADHPDAPKIGPVAAAQTRDVSKGGLSFHVDEPLAVGTVIALELEREFDGPPLSALGRVAHCREDEGGGYVVGSEFTWIECALPDVTLGLMPENAWTLL